jgi:hypothetical protein
MFKASNIKRLIFRIQSYRFVTWIKKPIIKAISVEIRMKKTVVDKKGSKAAERK